MNILFWNLHYLDEGEVEYTEYVKIYSDEDLIRPCLINASAPCGEGFFRQTRRIFAGILYVFQENATKPGGKRPAAGCAGIFQTRPNLLKKIFATRKVQFMLYKLRQQSEEAEKKGV